MSALLLRPDEYWAMPTSNFFWLILNLNKKNKDRIYSEISLVRFNLDLQTFYEAGGGVSLIEKKNFIAREISVAIHKEGRGS